MILMNNQVAKLFQIHKVGIFRRTISTGKENTHTRMENLPKSVSSFFSNKCNGSGNYCAYSENVAHESLQLDAYVHITSPIRRIVDLLNMICIQNILKLQCEYQNTTNDKILDGRCIIFNNWYNETNLNYINETSKNIKKVQNDCRILGLVTHDETLLNTIYDGYIVEVSNNKNGKNKYEIYLDQFNVVLNYSTDNHEYQVGDKLQFKIVLFMDEHAIKQKIRLQHIN
jgi:exoribonuclease R